MTDTPQTDAALQKPLRAFAQGCRGSMWQSRDETTRLMDEAADALDARDAVIADLVEALEEIMTGKNKDGLKTDFPSDIARAALSKAQEHREGK